MNQSPENDEAGEGDRIGVPASGLDLCYLNAIDLAARIRRKDLSAVEVMTAYLDRIDDVNPQVNAIVSLVDRETALGMARQADADLHGGSAIGKLHGLPMACKDTVETQGIRTTYGSPIFEDFVPDEDALLAARLRAAGALIIGKTNVPEFAAGSNTFNPVFGATRNPYNLALTAGGSSGGAAAALASGMLPLADGSDTGGSIRNPASWNNIAGLRPSMGRVPAASPTAWFSRLPVEGPMGRTVADVAFLLSVLAGPDPLDPISLDDDPAIFAAPLDRDFRGTRIAWTPDLGYLPVEQQVVDATATAIPILESIGCTVTGDHPELHHVRDAFQTLRGVMVAANAEPLFASNRHLIKDALIGNIELGWNLSAFDVTHAEQQRTKIYHAVRTFLERYEFLVLPVTQVVPFPVEVEFPTEINGTKLSTYTDWIEICYAFTLTGLPAMSVPCAFTDAGMPVGLQIVGRHSDDLGVLQLGHAFEQAAALGRPRVPLQ